MCNYNHDIALVDQGGSRPTFGMCLHVYDDILRLSGTTLEKMMKQWLEAYYLFMDIYILTIVC